VARGGVNRHPRPPRVIVAYLPLPQHWGEGEQGGEGSWTSPPFLVSLPHIPTELSNSPGVILFTMNTFIDVVILLLGVLALMSILLHPSGGVIARFRRNRVDRSRTEAEDALKHAYDCEHRAVSCTVQSIAGVLAISIEAAGRLASRLESMGLLRSDAAALHLTSDGRAYALRVVRIHRLWERYLADETSVREDDWHRKAELQEHKMTPEEADSLAASLGNPQFDPHGDPIPTAGGDVPEQHGVPLTTLHQGDFAGVLHIEDEPPEVYSQITALGFYPGMQIQVLATEPGRVRLDVNGEEVVLAPLLAETITVAPLPEDRRKRGPFVTLATVQPGEEVQVTSISRACRGQQRRRMMDLGIVPGTLITPEMESFAGDPVAYRVRGTLVALRREQAEQIFVRSVAA
jgi:DtxR family transcriptional regulator, Mn-dependent transcriptional regulator